MPQRTTITTPRAPDRDSRAGQSNINPGRARPSGEARHRVIVVSAPEDVPRALQHPAVAAGRLDVASVFTIDVDEAEAGSGFKTIADEIRASSADTILVAGPLGSAAMRTVADLALLYKCELLAVMPSEVPEGHDPRIVWSGDSPLVQLARIPRQNWERLAKRALDVAGAVVGLIVAAPLLVVLCALIVLETPGWPIFRHVRIGYRGRRFACLKLRTMRSDAEEHLRNDPELYEEYRRNHYKLPDDRDPRTTTLGRFLRRTSLDELPQLWNVLMGDMSLVGPRPVVHEELENYGDARDLLLSIRPGITGAWAVSGRHDLGYPDRCEIELDYVRRWTISQDVGILLRTISAVRKSAADSAPLS